MAFEKFLTTDQKLDNLGKKVDSIILDLDLFLLSQIENLPDDWGRGVSERDQQSSQDGI